MMPIPDGCQVSTVEYNGNPIAYSLRGSKAFNMLFSQRGPATMKLALSLDTTPPSVMKILPAKGQLE